jgi:hypothetical protein
LFDLPRRAEIKVAWLLLDRRADPSSKEGIMASSTFRRFIHTFVATFLVLCVSTAPVIDRIDRRYNAVIVSA